MNLLLSFEHVFFSNGLQRYDFFLNLQIFLNLFFEKYGLKPSFGYDIRLGFKPL